MRPFRFRAAGALTLRQKHEDEARIAVGRAQNAAAVAETRLELARRHATHARDQLVAVQQRGAPAWLISWHRSWIAQRSAAVEARGRESASAAASVSAAEAQLQEAYRRRRVLERLRDRLAKRHAQEGERRALNAMNELAGLRYLAAVMDEKE